MKKKFKIWSFICLLFFPLLVIGCRTETPAVINNKKNENVSIFLSKNEKINMNNFVDNSKSNIKIAQNIFNQAVSDNKIPNSQNISFKDLTVSNVNLNLSNLKPNALNMGSVILKITNTNIPYIGTIRIGFWYTFTIFNFTINLDSLIDATKYNYFSSLESFENNIWQQAIKNSSWQSSAPTSMADYNVAFSIPKMPVDKNQENILVPFTLEAKWKMASKYSSIKILGNFNVNHLRLPSIMLNPLINYSISSLRQIMWTEAAKQKISSSDYQFISNKNGAIINLKNNSWIKYNLLFKNKNNGLFLEISGYFLLRTKPGPTPTPIPVPNPPGGGGGPSDAKIINIYLQETYFINSVSDAPNSQKIWNDANQYLINHKIITTNLSDNNFYKVGYNTNNQLVSWTTAIKDSATALTTASSLSSKISNINYNNLELFALNNTFSTNFESDLDIYVSFIGNINKYQLPDLITSTVEYSNGTLAYNNFLLKAINNFITENNLPNNYIVTNSNDFISNYDNAIKNFESQLPVNLILQFSDNSKILLTTNLNLISNPINANLSVNLNIDYYDSSREKPDFFATEAKILTNQIWSQTSKEILLNKQLKKIMLNSNLWNISVLQKKIYQDLNNNNLNIKTFALQYFDQNVYSGVVNLIFTFNPISIKPNKNINLENLGSYNIPYLISESKNNTLYLQEINKIIYTLKQKLPPIIADKSPSPHLPASLTLIDWNYMFQQIYQSLSSVTKLGPTSSVVVSYSSDLKNTTFLYDGILSFTLTFTFNMSQNIGWGQ